MSESAIPAAFNDAINDAALALARLSASVAVVAIA
jgi:hypothetical protein